MDNEFARLTVERQEVIATYEKAAKRLGEIERRMRDILLDGPKPPEPKP